MKTKFPNPIDKAFKKEKSSPWNFEQPHYDQRSSCFVNAGSNYGVGHKQPVGHKGNPKTEVPCLPHNKKLGMEVDEVAKPYKKAELYD